MQRRAPLFDQAVSALVEDLHERRLDRRVMVIVTGEFGRTPTFWQPFIATWGSMPSGSRSRISTADRSPYSATAGRFRNSVQARPNVKQTALIERAVSTPVEPAAPNHSLERSTVPAARSWPRASQRERELVFVRYEL